MLSFPYKDSSSSVQLSSSELVMSVHLPSTGSVVSAKDNTTNKSTTGLSCLNLASPNSNSKRCSNMGRGGEDQLSAGEIDNRVLSGNVRSEGKAFKRKQS